MADIYRPGTSSTDPPPLVFLSWDDYLAKTSIGERMTRCSATAKRANRKRLLSATVETRLSGQDVWAILEAAQGRCVHCDSLAVENRPSNPVTGRSRSVGSHWPSHRQSGAYPDALSWRRK